MMPKNFPTLINKIGVLSLKMPFKQMIKKQKNREKKSTFRFIIV